MNNGCAKATSIVKIDGNGKVISASQTQRKTIVTADGKLISNESSSMSGNYSNGSINSRDGNSVSLGKDFNKIISEASGFTTSNDISYTKHIKDESMSEVEGAMDMVANFVNPSWLFCW